eukprot:scaffold2733_cov39-Phaeocystis_antarctica.AAC.1
MAVAAVAGLEAPVGDESDGHWREHLQPLRPVRVAKERAGVVGVVVKSPVEEADVARHEKVSELVLPGDG